MTVKAERFTASVHIREKPSDPLAPGDGVVVQVIRYRKANSNRCPTCGGLVNFPMLPETAARIIKVRRGESP